MVWDGGRDALLYLVASSWCMWVSELDESLDGYVHICDDESWTCKKCEYGHMDIIM